MRMINIKRSFIALATLSALVSCDDFLDKLPDNRMELKNKDEVAKLLINAYPTETSAYLLETFSDNTDEYINSAWTEADRFQTEAWSWGEITANGTGGTPQELWDAYYRAIASANQAIEYIDAQSDQSAYGAELGEALLCRAFNMFKLAEVFCPAYDPATAATSLGVPYPLAPEKSIGEILPRETVEILFRKIDQDLQRGLPLVTNEYAAPKFHFTLNAAYAFACRFYLNYRKFDQAIEYAGKVLGSNPTSKLRDWATWKTLSANDQIQPNAYVSSKNPANLLILPVNSEWGVIAGPYSHGQKYRHGALISEKETLESKGPWGTSNSVLGYKVFSNPSLAGHFIRNIPYAFEYTDVQAGIGYPHAVMVEFSTDKLLMERAEANALAGNYQAAVDDINAELAAYQVSGRATLTLDDIVAYYSAIDYYTVENPTVKKEFHTTLVTDMEVQEPLLQCIAHLSRILTMHEGHRLQFVKRYGITMERRSLNASQQLLKVKDTMAAGDLRLAIQLPNDVISAGVEANPR